MNFDKLQEYLIINRKNSNECSKYNGRYVLMQQADHIAVFEINIVQNTIYKDTFFVINTCFSEAALLL